MKKIFCKNCDKPTTNKKFCSRSCSAKIGNLGKQKNPPKERKCTKCGASFFNAKGYISRLCRSCKDKRKRPPINKFTTLGELAEACKKKNIHRSWWFSEVRGTNRIWNKHLLIECQNCKYDLHVELAHIKPIKDFDMSATLGEINDVTNVLGLCRNCHWEFDNGYLAIDNILK